ncbi:MAG: tRNA (adenosine(37)-N6)-threonylcarbamoyltransferase complex transferase subunit TsaD [Candidatus Peregrinibacteria bacterium]
MHETAKAQDDQTNSLILALETSCDETAAAVIQSGTIVRSCVIASSRSAFERSGGVIPEHAARAQIASILPVIDQALQEAKVTVDDIAAIAVTRGPGLLGSLLVGTVTGRTMASLRQKPLIGVHHTLGHLSSTWLETTDTPQFPILTLSASGGHSDLWYRVSHTTGTLLGSTRDDAAGEAFDKGAHLLGLPYPGGPSIAKAAEDGDIHAFPFPLPLAHDTTLDFSFAGLKTALKYTLRDLPIYPNTPTDSTLLTTHYSLLTHLAASYQHALCRHLVDKLIRAVALHPETKEIHLVGGVAANLHLRDLVSEAFPDRVIRWPKMIVYCTDNAAMIGAAAFFLMHEKGEKAFQDFSTEASLPLMEALKT